ncbi:MAG: response regulator [Pyrinomonadaceae bacterium]
MQHLTSTTKVLVVDDEADIRLMFELFLRQAGYEVVTAGTAQQALVAAQTENFGVVISDIGMPKMDGYQLAAALRRLPAYENVPLIAVTGFVEFINRERALSAGFNEHLTKPVNLESLLRLIKRIQRNSLDRQTS